jgi:Bromodomain
MAPFERPVSLADYPDYLQFVQTPMDLQQVERKTKAGQYDMPEDFEYDMSLVFKNCETYNAHRKGDHLVAMSRFGAKQFRRLFTARMKAFEDPSAVPIKDEQKDAPSMSINASKKIKAEPLSGASKGKAAPPRISITAAQVTSAVAQEAKTPKVPPSAASSWSTNKNRAQPVKADQPVPLHIAIARVKVSLLATKLPYRTPLASSSSQDFPS